MFRLALVSLVVEAEAIQSSKVTADDSVEIVGWVDDKKNEL